MRRRKRRKRRRRRRKKKKNVMEKIWPRKEGLEDLKNMY